MSQEYCPKEDNLKKDNSEEQKSEVDSYSDEYNSEEEYESGDHDSEEDDSEEEYQHDEHTHRLSSTMAMLSETYPTVVYYKKAIACGMPLHFMDLRFPPDKWGRVPCKHEAMDWYLRHSSVDSGMEPGTSDSQ